MLFHGYINHMDSLQQTRKLHTAHLSQQKPHIYNFQRLKKLEQMIHSSYCCTLIKHTSQFYIVWVQGEISQL